MTATSMSEKASETMKKFCTVLNGRKVKTERITSMLPKMQRITMLERTSATGTALANGIGSMAVKFSEPISLSVKFDDEPAEMFGFIGEGSEESADEHDVAADE